MSARPPAETEVPAGVARPPVTPPSSRRRFRRWEIIGVAAALLFSGWFFQFMVRANNGFEDWGDLDYYKLLVRGWRKGQLNIDKDPSPELLALKDPYDPEQNGPYKLGDISLYQGKYYTYFGAAPALTLMWPYAALTGRELVTGQATLVFCLVALLTASWLWLAVRGRYFPDSHPLIAPAGILCLAFGTHLLALAQRPMMWELPISAGIAFTLLAAAACFRAVHGERPVLAMAAAGLCLGLAVGSRPTCLFAGGMLLVPVWRAWREARPGREWWRLALAAGVPLALCGVAIMAHNHARFDNPLEWGQNYQLSGAYESKLVHFAARFFPHNLSVYLFQPLLWSTEFPFAFAQAIEISHIPDYFGTEEVCGLAVTFPYVWFLLALPFAWWRRDGIDFRGLGAAVFGVALYVVPVGGLILSYFSTTMRYQTDYAVGLGLLALIGLLALERRARSAGLGWTRLVLVSSWVAALVTISVGTLVAFDYHGRSMRQPWSRGWQPLARASEEFLAEAGRRVGVVDGPEVLKTRFNQRPTGTVETFWRPADESVKHRILVEHIGERLIRFGISSEDAPVIWGRPLKWDPGHTHTVTVQSPALYRPGGHRWARGARRVEEFRERTGIAVGFSGGRAVQTVGREIQGEYRAGGMIGADFSGEVRDRFSRLFRRDELTHGLTDDHAPRGGVLRMRVVLPSVMRPEGEPIFAAGAHYRSNILFVEPAPGGVKFTYERYTIPRVSSPVIAVNPRGHEIEFSLPSFNPAAYGHEADGEAVLRIDGVEVFRTKTIGYEFPWGQERLGNNPFGHTTGEHFRGWLLDVRWTR
ncbi:MAG: hypothetical protein ACKOE8_11885 [Opitutaceae bacterium]